MNSEMLTIQLYRCHASETAHEYLERFGCFVRDNVSNLECLQAILHAPERWSTDTADELDALLFRMPNMFNESRLTQSAKEFYGIEADTLSLVKRSLNASYPLLTLQQRTHRAVRRVLEAMQAREQDDTLLNFIERQFYDYGARALCPLNIGADSASGMTRLSRQLQCDMTGFFAALNRAFAED